MKIALFGVTGAIGSYFLEKAVAAGDEVFALARSPEKLDEHPNLFTVKDDITNMSNVQFVMDHADVAVSCLGSVKGILIMEKAAEVILQAAAGQSNPQKCLFVSSIGYGGKSWVVKQMLQIIGGRSTFTDYERTDKRILQETRVPYVLIRPAALKEKPGKGKYRVFQTEGTFVRPIAKVDVAAFLLNALQSDQWDGEGGFQLAGMK